MKGGGPSRDPQPLSGSRRFSLLESVALRGFHCRGRYRICCDGELAFGLEALLPFDRFIVLQTAATLRLGFPWLRTGSDHDVRTHSGPSQPHQLQVLCAAGFVASTDKQLFRGAVAKPGPTLGFFLFGAAFASLSPIISSLSPPLAQRPRNTPLPPSRVDRILTPDGRLSTSGGQLAGIALRRHRRQRSPPHSRAKPRCAEARRRRGNLPQRRGLRARTRPIRPVHASHS